uniref:Uncharacterized protein n=1 Tax=Papilio xuthus TaxID=66420 RepID=I4DLQ6_PAPXU|nr:unknown unsecreted protein [Papilio xuthus]
MPWMCTSSTVGSMPLKTLLVSYTDMGSMAHGVHTFDICIYMNTYNVLLELW